MIDEFYDDTHEFYDDTHFNTTTLCWTKNIYLTYSWAIYFDFFRFADFIALKSILAHAE